MNNPIKHAWHKTALQQVKRAIREPYAWPGGYPVYTIMSDGDFLCADCARKEYRQIVRDTVHGFYGFSTVGADVYWEGPDEYCAHCNKALQSAYGEPSEE